MGEITKENEMEDFAKVFNTVRGQIVVMRDSDDDGDPALMFYAEPSGLGVCRLTLSFSDDDEGWDKLDDAFAKADERMALEVTKDMFSLGDKVNEQNTN